jgi:hypothetical protein
VLRKGSETGVAADQRTIVVQAHLRDQRISQPWAATLSYQASPQ